jgi:hypothetical protein
VPPEAPHCQPPTGPDAGPTTAPPVNASQPVHTTQDSANVNNQSHKGSTSASPSAKETLDRLVSKSIASFAAASTWEEFVGKCRDPRGEFHPDVKHLPHRAAHMLNCLRTRGATVGLKTGKWT